MTNKQYHAHSAISKSEVNKEFATKAQEWLSSGYEPDLFSFANEAEIKAKYKGT